MLAFDGEKDSIHVDSVTENIFSRSDSLMGNITMVYSLRFYNIDQLPVYIDTMKKALTQCLVIGKSQRMECNNLPPLGSLSLPIMDKTMENRLLQLIESKSMKLLKNEFFKLFSAWEQNLYPQVWVEKMLKQIFMLVEKHSPDISTKLSLSIEQQLEEVVSASTSFGELMRAVWDMIVDMLGDEDNNMPQGDSSGDLLEKVDIYIRTNLAETISLQSVCKVFGVSQPYLSRLFRKYKSMSFNEYVTDIRVEKAKQLMCEYPDMFLKDIAEVTGFNDQYYFSKLFKYVTGISPSEFKTKSG